MQKYLVHACLLGCVVIHADTGKTPNGQAPINYEAWKEALPLTSDAHDVMILQDGTRIYARINQLPPITYNFTTISLPVEEISMASFYRQNGIIKVQYVTRDGLNYAGPVPQNYLLIYQISSANNEFAPQDLQKINAILFHPRSPGNVKHLKEVKNRIAHLELKNGDQIPFISSGECLSLRSQGKYYECLMGDIVEAVLEEKPHLVIQTKNGREEYHDFVIREPYFHFYLPYTNEKVFVPWTNIARIYQEQFLPKIAASIPPAATPSESFPADNQIAFAGEGLMVFLHPVESPISLFSGKDSSGFSISHVKIKEKKDASNQTEESTSRKEEKKQVKPVLAAFGEFESPILAAYDLESGEASHSLIIDKINSEKHTDIATLDPEDIVKPAKHVDEVPKPERVTISPEELTLIHDQLVFENLEYKDINPDSFYIETDKSDEEEEESFTFEHYMLTVKPDFDNQLDVSGFDEQQNSDGEEIALADIFIKKKDSFDDSTPIEVKATQDEIDVLTAFLEEYSTDEDEDPAENNPDPAENTQDSENEGSEKSHEAGESENLTSDQRPQDEDEDPAENTQDSGSENKEDEKSDEQAVEEIAENDKKTSIEEVSNKPLEEEPEGDLLSNVIASLPVKNLQEINISEEIPSLQEEEPEITEDQEAEENEEIYKEPDDESEEGHDPDLSKQDRIETNDEVTDLDSVPSDQRLTKDNSDFLAAFLAKDYLENEPGKNILENDDEIKVDLAFDTIEAKTEEEDEQQYSEQIEESPSVVHEELNIFSREPSISNESISLIGETSLQPIEVTQSIIPESAIDNEPLQIGNLNQEELNIFSREPSISNESISLIGETSLQPIEVTQSIIPESAIDNEPLQIGNLNQEELSIFSLEPSISNESISLIGETSLQPIEVTQSIIPESAIDNEPLQIGNLNQEELSIFSLEPSISNESISLIGETRSLQPIEATQSMIPESAIDNELNKALNDRIASTEEVAELNNEIVNTEQTTEEVLEAEEEKQVEELNEPFQSVDLFPLIHEKMNVISIEEKRSVLPAEVKQSLINEQELALALNIVMASAEKAKVQDQIPSPIVEETIPQEIVISFDNDIDERSVTNEQYLQFVKKTSHRAPAHWINGKIPAGQEKMPIVNVSYKDAEAYAEWLGRRIPTSKELEKASKENPNIEWPIEGLLDWVDNPEKYRYGDYYTDYNTFRTAKIK